MKKVVLIRSNPVNPDPPVEKIANATFELLYDLMNGECKNKNLIYECNLVERESVRSLEEREKR